MQKITGIAEIIVPVALLLILGAFLNPTGLLMPESTEMMLLVFFALGFIAFLGLVWKEHPADEREHAHLLAAGRVSFFVGSSILTAGIVLEALKHSIDPWLIAALIFMILAKLVTRVWARLTH
jgi:hypothetical protein